MLIILIHNDNIGMMKIIAVSDNRNVTLTIETLVTNSVPITVVC